MADDRVGGVPLHAVDQGMGEPILVFLHYFGGSSRTWGPVMSLLSDEFRCLAPDLRGWGDSPAPVTAGYSVDDMADDVAGLVSRLGLTRWVLIGHSMGGKVALALAARRPAGLERLLLAAPSPPSPEPMESVERARLRAAWGSRRAAEETLGKITALPLPPDVAKGAVEDTLRASRAAWEAWLDAGSREDITGRMADIRVPTSILAGGADGGMTPDLLRREVQARIVGASLSVVPSGGHLLPLEAPRSVADWIRGAISLPSQ
jgi:pimeloyl-ACP methyl ester carboxylesterase